MTARRRALLLAVLAGLASGCHRDSRPGRNLVLIVIDTLRRDHLAAYGYEREPAPTLTRLAREGAILDAISPTSWTQPATASILTGLHPVRHQSIRTEPLPAQAETLAERLRARGYATLAVSANSLVSESFGFAQGFDEMVLLTRLAGRRLPEAHEVDEAVLPRLASLRTPFFLYVHYVDPHAPYGPARSWSGGPLSEHLRRRGPLVMSDLDPAKFAVRDDGVMADVLDLYDGEIRQADDGVRAILEELARRQLLESSLTVGTSDHGEEFEEHGRLSHGLSLYEEVLRVPWIVHAPGLVPAGTRHGTASLVDLAPTVLSLLGVAADKAAFDGVDLSSYLESGRRYSDPDRLFLAHLDTLDGTSLAATLGRHKLVLSRPYRKQLFEIEGGGLEGERENRIDEQRKTAADLGVRLADSYNDLARRALPREPPVPKIQAEALAAVGYLGPPPSDVRAIGPRIHPADPGDDGLLGWEDPASFKACATTADPGAAFQLLEGWYRIELDGRWTWPRASALLAASASPRQTLVIEGVNHERRPVRFRASIRGRRVLEQTVTPGPFVARADVDPGPPGNGLAVVRIERPAAFLPAREGLLDDRALGIFVTSICLGP
jgi:hypothetical protein